MVSTTQLVAAAFPNKEDAQRAANELKAHGFDESSISVLYTDAGSTVTAGAIDGAIWGGVFGGLFGLLFPPVGLIVAAGPILGILTAGAAGAALGAVTVAGLEALISALVQAGMPEEIATRFGQMVHKGDALLVVHAATPEQAETAKSTLARFNPRTEEAPDSSGVVTVTAPAAS
ncbi:MAG: hypothetical protein KatS3mg060_0467 [Dehalococcoidia bacterium]|jgi:hypothetical protein|nr:MAG: hypothetical protein KatS3mg060_0467 [Dehalococcoidia bacterium]